MWLHPRRVSPGLSVGGYVHKVEAICPDADGTVEWAYSSSSSSVSLGKRGTVPPGENDVWLDRSVCKACGSSP